MIELLVLALAFGPVDFPRDTVFDVREGDRLVLHDFRGELRVETWNRSQMRLVADTETGLTFRLRREGSRLTVALEDERGRERDQELRITVPPWMGLDIQGRDVNARIESLDGFVRIANLNGDIVLGDLSGEIIASSVQGDIVGSGLAGSARLSSGDGNLRVRDSSGALDLETLDGDIQLEGIASRNIAVRSADGDVRFFGELLEEGAYGFRTHGGNIRVYLASPVNVHALVLAYDGEFESDFPIRTSGFTSGQGLEFTLGNGSARLTLEAFDGDIELRRR